MVSKEEMEKLAKKETVTYYKPNFEQVVFGKYVGDNIHEVYGRKIESYVIETDDGRIEVPKYGYLLKHLKGMEVGDVVYIKLVSIGKDEVGKIKGYIFACHYEKDTIPF